jgi:transposase InsO family protein
VEAFFPVSRQGHPPVSPFVATLGKRYHPMTQGKIVERWHRSLKNRILLEHYYLPSELERQINEFVTYHNAKRYHESLNNLTPEDV